MSSRAISNDLPERAEDMICFAVYSTAHAINRAYAPLLKPLGLTYPQYIALTVLWEQDGLNVGELSKRLQMETNTLTPLLKRLEKLGHVDRRRGIEDERKVFVYLTKRGRALKKHAPHITACLVESTGMNSGELNQTIGLLNRLNTNLSDAA